MTDTEHTVYVGMSEPHNAMRPSFAAVCLPRWFAVVRIAEDGESPDLTPPGPMRDNGYIDEVSFRSYRSPVGDMRQAVRLALAIDAHRAEAARKAETPHPLDGLGVGSIVKSGRVIGTGLTWRLGSDGWSVLPRRAGDEHDAVPTEGMNRTLTWTILHREPATPEPEPGPDPRRPDLRVGLVITDEPPHGWEFRYGSDDRWTWMRGPDGWGCSDHEAWNGSMKWSNDPGYLDATLDATLVAFHPEHAGLDPEPSPCGCSY